METINLPAVVRSLVDAQERHDNEAYARCFAVDATVFDEGKTHQGYVQIKKWITEANAKYKTRMEPFGYDDTSAGGVLKAKISGTFDGSPVVLAYHLILRDGLIASLEISG